MVVNSPWASARGLGRSRLPAVPTTQRGLRSRTRWTGETASGHARTARRWTRSCSSPRSRSSATDGPAGAVRATQSYEQVREDVREDALALIALGLGALVLGLRVAWFLAGGLARPLARARGDGPARRAAAIWPRARRRRARASTQEVAREFNEMAERLGHALAAQREFAGQRLAPAAHAADRPEAAARGSELQDGRGRRAPRHRGGGARDGAPRPAAIRTS